jgi:hypothetical protein
MKFAAIGNDMAFWIFGVMRGSQASDDAIGGDDVKNIQIFDDGGGVSLERFIVDLAAGNFGMRGPKGHEVFEMKMVDVRVGVTTNRGQGSGRLRMDQAPTRMAKLTAKRVTFGMEVKRNSLS